MKIFSVLTFSALVFTTSLYSQAIDFQISEDKTPASFIQRYPKLYFNPYYRSLVVWEDLREGEPRYYAQMYDSLFKPIGKNFKTTSNFQFYFSKENYIALREESYNWSLPYDYSSFEIIGSIYNRQNEIVKEIGLAGGMYPWCGTGYLGTQPEMITCDSSFIFFFNDDGRVTGAKYNYEGDLLKSYSYQNSSLPINAGVISADINLNGNILFAWFNARTSDMPFGFYSTIFNSKDSVITSKKLLIPFAADSNGDDYFWGGRSPLLKVRAISDSLFEIFYVLKDSLKLFYAKIDEKGNLIGSLNEIKIPYHISNEINTYYSLYNFYVAPIVNDRFGIYFTVGTYSSGSEKDLSSIFYFNKDGNETWMTTIDSSQNLNFNDGVGLTNNDELYIPEQYKNDIYLKEYKGFTLVDSQKVNDDIRGSNQINLFVKKVNDKKFICGWNDEAGIKGVFIDRNGNKLSEELNLPGYLIEYFNDGSSVAIWKQIVSESCTRLGYSIIDPNQNVIYQEGLISSDYTGDLNADLKVITDSSFVILYGKYKNVKLASFNKNGKKSNEVIFPADYSYQSKIFRVGFDSIWVSCFGKLQLFSNGLTPLTQTVNLYPSIYLDNNNFLTINYSNYYGSYTYYGNIVTPSVDTLKRNFLLANNADELSVFNLTKDEFIVLYRMNDKIFAKTFSNNGKILMDSILIHQPISSYKRIPQMAAAGNNVLFTWSDARNDGDGYDIYGSIFKLSILTDVNEKIKNNLTNSFYLFQNYPNPFNPITTIRYEIPKQSKVELIVYNILGDEVAVLINGEKVPGSYDVKFDGSKLA
ncbi:MAG: hypothetical protein M1480_04430, partial [Bacteroidetes bacterium]|nr:hypothetical protein [Bacteroidota bacterium]